MKQFYILSACLALAVLCPVFAGCAAHKKITHLSSGYEEVSHPARSLASEPPPARVSFHHLGADGRTVMIWPSLYGIPEVIHDDLAIFVGDKTRVDAGALALRPRLFAVQPPALPLDITDEVLRRWSKTAGKDFKKVLAQFEVVTPEAGGGGLTLHFEFYSQDYLVVEKSLPDKADLQLDWNQVSDIMDTVKTKGVEKQDLGWKTHYIGEKP